MQTIEGQCEKWAKNPGISKCTLQQILKEDWRCHTYVHIWCLKCYQSMENTLAEYSPRSLICDTIGATCSIAGLKIMGELFISQNTRACQWYGSVVKYCHQKKTNLLKIIGKIMCIIVMLGTERILLNTWSRSGNPSILSTIPRFVY